MKSDYILKLRKAACDTVLKSFVLKNKTPIWVCNIAESEPDPVEYYRQQKQLSNERAICRNNCLPIALATSKQVKIDHTYQYVRVVVGFMGSSDTNTTQSELKKIKKKYLSLREFTDFETPFHAWVEVSNDNFTTTEIIDLTYSFPHEKRKNIDNFSTNDALDANLKHEAVLTDTKDVKSFFYYLLKSQLRDETELDTCFKVAVEHLD